MQQTFATEDQRKTQLFQAWIAYLAGIHEHIEVGGLAELREGLAWVTELTKNRISLRFEDGRAIRHIPISPAISAHSLTTDCLYIVIGRKGKTWWPLEVVSVGSLFGNDPAQFHMTVNPLLMNAAVGPTAARTMSMH